MAEDNATPQDDRTEAATPRRLQRAREEGQVPVSREMVTLAGLVAVALLTVIAGPALLRELTYRLRGFLARWAAASLERERGERWRARGVLAAVGAWRPLLASLASPPPPSSFSSFPAATSSANASPIASSSPDAAASLRRALRARGIATGEEGEEREKAEENAAACSRQWGECLAAAAAL